MRDRPERDRPDALSAQKAPPSERPQSPAERAAQVRKLFKDLLPEVLQQLDAPAPAAPPAGLVLDAFGCRALDDILGLGATRTQEDLIQAAVRLGTIKVGDVRIPFTPGQLSELQHRAMKRGRTVEQEIRAVVARLEDELFYKGG